MDPRLQVSLIASAAILAFAVTTTLVQRLLKVPVYRPNTWRDFFLTVGLNRYDPNTPYSVFKRKGGMWLALTAGVLAAVVSAILVAMLTG